MTTVLFTDLSTRSARGTLQGTLKRTKKMTMTVVATRSKKGWTDRKQKNDVNTSNIALPESMIIPHALFRL